MSWKRERVHYHYPDRETGKEVCVGAVTVRDCDCMAHCGYLITDDDEPNVFVFNAFGCPDHTDPGQRAFAIIQAMNPPPPRIFYYWERLLDREIRSQGPRRRDRLKARLKKLAELAAPQFLPAPVGP